MRAFRGPGIIAYGVWFAAGLACFPLSIQFTFGANTLIILASSPLLAAVGARIFLGEPIAKRTWIAAFAALGGVALIFSGGGDSAGKFAAADTVLIGNLLALASAAAIAGASIVARRHHSADTIPGIALGAALAALVFAPFAEWTTLFDSGFDLALIIANGALIVPLSFALINLASRILPPPEVGLIFLLEMALGPLWLALGANEIPPPPTIAAGALMALIFAAHTAAARYAAVKLRRKGV
jgi:drug/metabolite transporter (DMT)-like permease